MGLARLRFQESSAPFCAFFALEKKHGYGSIHLNIWPYWPWLKNGYGSLHGDPDVWNEGVAQISQMSSIFSKGSRSGVWIGGMDQGYGSPVRRRFFLIGTLHFELQPYVHHVHPEITAISSYFDVNYWGTGVVAKECPLEQPLLVDSMPPIQVNQGPAWRQSRDVASIAMSTPFNWLVVSILPL